MPDMSPADDQVKNDFLSVRARTASGGDDQWMRDLAAGGAKPAAAPAVPADGQAQPPPPHPNATFWDIVGRNAAQFGKDLTAPAAEAAADIKGDIVNPLDHTQQIGGVDLSGGSRLAKLMMDVGRYVYSPVEGAARAVVGRPLDTATGGRLDAATTGAGVAAIAGGAEGALRVGGAAEAIPAAAAEDAGASAEAAAAAEAPAGDEAPAAAADGAEAPPPVGDSAPAAAQAPAAAAEGAAGKAGQSEPFDFGAAMGDLEKPGDKPAAEQPAGPQRAFLILPEKDPVSITPDVARMADDFIAGKTGDNPVTINLAHIDGPEGIEDVLTRVASTIPDSGVQSHETTAWLASLSGVRPQDMMAGWQGELPTAARMKAMGMITLSGAEQLGAYARLAMDPVAGTAEAKAAALRAFATQRQIQSYFQNVKTETARSLNILGSMTRGSSGYSQAVKSIVEGAGEDLNTVLGRIADLGDPATGGNPAEISKYVQKSGEMSTRDLVLYGFYNTRLSNFLKVVGKKLISDGSMALWNLAVRYSAEKFGPSDGVAAGETAQLLNGYVTSMRDAFRLARQGLATGERQFDLGYDQVSSLPRENAALGQDGTQAASHVMDRISAAADGATQTLDPSQPTRAAVDYLKMALPTRWIGAADDFAKYVNYRGEMKALAYRDGMSRGLTDAALSDHVGGLMDTPTQALHEQAKAAALRNTFQEPLSGLGQSLVDVIDKFNAPVLGTQFKIPLGRMVAPFPRISTNMMATVYRNSPVAAIFPSDAIKAEFAAGGATRDLMMARVGLGTAMTVVFGSLATAGLITGGGPSDPSLRRAWRAAGNEPYSITLGGRPYTYNQIDPIGMHMALIADTFDLMKFAREEDSTQLALSAVFGTGKALMSKTYMSGVADLLDAFEHPDEQASRYGKGFVSGLLVPGAVQALDTATDPWVRAHYGLLDSIWARTPFASEGLPPLRTLWGDAIPARDGFLPPFSGTGLARSESPIRIGAPADNAEPIDKWIWNNRAAFPHSDQGRLDLYKPGEYQTFYQPGTNKGVAARIQLTPQELDRLIVQAGNGLKDPASGLGAKDALNALVTGTFPNKFEQSQFDRLSPQVQALKISDRVQKSREVAQQQLLAQSPRLQDAVQAQWAARRQQLQPAPSPSLGLPSIAAAPATAGMATSPGNIKAPTLGAGP